jgi:hypothetical protein
MRKINIKDIAEESWTSPKGKFGGASKEISVALGRKPLSTDLNERHPFDIEICRIPPGKSHCPYHSHSAQWEFYHGFRARALSDMPMGPLQSKLAAHSSSGQTNLTSLAITGHRISCSTS